MNHFDLTDDDVGHDGPLIRLGADDYELCNLECRTGTLLDTNLWKSHYFPGYERGNCVLQLGILEWLELILPGSSVFYGQDEDGIGYPFGEPERSRLKRYHDRVGHAPYRSNNWDIKRLYSARYDEDR